jgi:hypothetical protein
MIGPPQDPEEKCGYCGHTHDQHSSETTCGCQLACTIAGCRCHDFTYTNWWKAEPIPPAKEAHRVARDMTLSTDWPV